MKHQFDPKEIAHAKRWSRDTREYLRGHHQPRSRSRKALTENGASIAPDHPGQPQKVLFCNHKMIDEILYMAISFARAIMKLLQREKYRKITKITTNILVIFQHLNV